MTYLGLVVLLAVDSVVRCTTTLTQHHAAAKQTEQKRTPHAAGEQENGHSPENSSPFSDRRPYEYVLSNPRIAIIVEKDFL